MGAASRQKPTRRSRAAPDRGLCRAGPCKSIRTLLSREQPRAALAHGQPERRLRLEPLWSSHRRLVSSPHCPSSLKLYAKPNPSRIQFEPSLAKPRLTGSLFRAETQRRATIPKPGGGERPLRVPTIRDRWLRPPPTPGLDPGGDLRSGLRRSGAAARQAWPPAGRRRPLSACGACARGGCVSRRLAGVDALGANGELDPPHRKPRQPPPAPVEANGGPLSERIASGSPNSQNAASSRRRPPPPSAPAICSRSAG